MIGFRSPIGIGWFVVEFHGCVGKKADPCLNPLEAGEFGDARGGLVDEALDKAGKALIFWCFCIKTKAH